MKFSYFWLKDLVKFKESPEKLADLLTLYLAETTVSYQNKRPILDVDLLPNRFPDSGSHLGLAREISAILGKQFNYPQIQVKEIKNSIKQWVIITNKSKNCYQYTSRCLFNVKVKPSPKWLQDKLIDCGLRPINNIVDATNYIMLLTGQPLHAFDFDKVSMNKQKKKEIIIRQAKEQEKITTLDNKTYSLSSNVLLICDTNKPLAIAGIKGGINADVNKNTKHVILESANFNPVNIRQSSRELNLKTDASIRFEHGVPIELTSYALDLVAQLIHDLSEGVILRDIAGISNYQISKLIFAITESECQKFLGWPISLKDIKNKLQLLGFNIKKQNNKQKTLLVEPPLYRHDIVTKEDIIGEIGRLFGFDRIAHKTLTAQLTIPKKNELWNFINYLTDLFQSYNFTEVKNYSLISVKDKQMYRDTSIIIDLLNPISDSFNSFRPNLINNLLHNIDLNYRFYEEMKIFEIGNSYIFDHNKIKERLLLSGAWANKNAQKEEIVFYQIKGIIESLFKTLNISEKEYSLESINWGYNIILNSKQKKIVLGTVLCLDKKLKDKFELEGSIVIFELDILLLKNLIKPKKYHQIPSYPPALRDISCLVDKNISIGDIIKNIRQSSLLLESLELFDVYQGKNIGSNKKSLSFHLVFRSRNKTLSNEEINEEMIKIIKNLKQLGADIR